MKNCELCRLKASIYCGSDKASLCWGCDARVHSANFLVARHSRYLLCGVCRSPTPWAASGAVLSPTVAICEECVDGKRGTGERKEVVEENHVVQPLEISSCSGEALFPRKRRLVNVDVDDRHCSSHKLKVHAPPPAASACGLEKESSPPQKVRRTTSFRAGEILESLRRFHREEWGSGLLMAECCTLSEDGPSDVDLSSCDSS